MSLNVRDTPYEPITYMAGNGYEKSGKRSNEVKKLEARVRELEENIKALKGDV
jgi:hypothetical protein